jgi:hypothetical protein
LFSNFRAAQAANQFFRLAAEHAATDQFHTPCMMFHNACSKKTAAAECLLPFPPP